ncbi:phage adaptor protein [Celeribacter naphthalenivorans]|uniref:phage adaptor protein n=1 Tax=Celeribacter naphthalenivorans TaxID=1614694 RepID=UPI001CFA38E5|nr:hypothetical protein [Celeribacter naphthalenivorans]
MTLIVDALNRIARKCSVAAPSSWVTATTQTHVEIRDDFLVEAVDEITKRVDWPAPVSASTTITGDGSAEYDLPADFRRLQFGDAAVYETTSTRRFGVNVPSDGAWTHLLTTGTGGGNRFFRIKGYDGNFSIEFYPVLASGVEVTINYVSTLWMANAAGTAGGTFSSETDVLLFPRRLIELGTIKRFREQKGLEPGPEGQEFEAWLLSEEKRLRSRGAICFSEKSDRHPMRLPVPDYITSS